mmetsp:Transcript_24154/g.57111  ORF Transcript_24154/g.57111 Transcript_24154/m.57111 type:complete len:403 (-) Transcript_24154:206-1414(-)|eukprot:CAMPEP_0113468164 /NCGR_PEP_ID=MMETSP0014_2-20120614/15207_1 /TAXON_ID=2857 /ORGANISM="Nitzschia sp." /LENGTH=402 /DNA_ID=CAMNT_0000360531 /DNA_START=94 /DNA_END=1302 /DNA_ORIENTATION=- /assembly_acc=CAM_ASM_000159
MVKVKNKKQNTFFFGFGGGVGAIGVEVNKQNFSIIATIFTIALVGGLFFVVLQSEESRISMKNSVRSSILRKKSNSGSGTSSSTTTTTTTATVQAHSSKTIFSKSKQPHLIYGTAWKKDMTSHHVHQAVKSGFRFIDTACQPRHYNEKLVGDGWTSAAHELGLERHQIWIQTKYTPPSGQDPNDMPYDPTSDLKEQAKTSLEVSLANLKTDYLDSWVLHSPFEVFEDTMRVWRVMEQAVDDGYVKQIGISNCYDLTVFQTLYQQANHKPAVLQNRFYEESNFDTELRKFCRARGVQYQSFWTLTANRHALATQEVKELAASKNLTPQTLLYAFLMSLSRDGGAAVGGSSGDDGFYITPLDGTTNPEHMVEDVTMMERLQNGEKIFTQSEIKHFAKLLGMPDL